MMLKFKRLCSAVLCLSVIEPAAAMDGPPPPENERSAAYSRFQRANEQYDLDLAALNSTPLGTPEIAVAAKRVIASARALNSATVSYATGDNPAEIALRNQVAKILSTAENDFHIFEFKEEVSIEKSRYQSAREQCDLDFAALNHTSPCTLEQSIASKRYLASARALNSATIAYATGDDPTEVNLRNYAAKTLDMAEESQHHQDAVEQYRHDFAAFNNTSPRTPERSIAAKHLLASARALDSIAVAFFTGDDPLHISIRSLTAGILARTEESIHVFDLGSLGFPGDEYVGTKALKVAMSIPLAWALKEALAGGALNTVVSCTPMILNISIVAICYSIYWSGKKLYNYFYPKQQETGQKTTMPRVENIDEGYYEPRCLVPLSNG